jgi:hypothetical protein
MPKPLRVVFCLPGGVFSGRFLDCWTELLGFCQKAGIDHVVSRHYDPVVYYARNKILGGVLQKGPAQLPWQGAVEYDFMLWIDSDVIFKPQDFVALLKHNLDVVNGVYVMANGTHYPVVEHLDEELFRKTGSFAYLSREGLSAKTGIFQVGYSGFGFTLIKRGVFERLQYPWFRPIYMKIGDTEEFTSEDVGFCLKAREAGIPIHVDPAVRVGHEKLIVLR